ncbi:MAG: hypothetical protein K2Q18_17160 [Bdellovibrionales bacterium]|nr:hypothetical protein [Bdellovibrionales bacterium]
MQTWTSRNYRKEDKIYRGSFNYFRNENAYTEETFEVYRDKKEQSYHYISEAVVKVTTGEILNLQVEYVVNKDYIPTFVLINKIMGKETARETYEYNSKRNQIIYKFTNSKGEETINEIVTAPKFHITTPTAASSMLFLRSKKFDTSGKNSFNLLVGFNQWEYRSAPVFKIVMLERANLTVEKMNIDGQNVQATQFRMYDEEVDTKSTKEPQHIRVYISQHGGIPYLIRSEDGTKIQIKYLNDLNEKE